MSPELIIAIKERIVLGRKPEEIESEVLNLGYSAEQFTEAYQAATMAVAAGPQSVLNPGTTNPTYSTTSTLISTGDLIGQMWNLMKSEKGVLGKTIGMSLLALLAVVVICGGIFVTVGETFPLIALFILGYFALMLGYGFLYFVMIRALLRRGTPVPFLEHVKWTLRNLVTLFTIGLMVMGASVMGYFFLIIPGLMLLIYLSMALNFTIDERASGLDALVLSTKFVYGRFWPIFGRLLITGLVAGFISFVIMMLGFFTLFLAPIAFLVAMFVSYYSLACAWVIVYESLLVVGPKKPLPVSDSTLRTIYMTAGIIGALLYIGLMSWSMFDTATDLSGLFS